MKRVGQLILGCLVLATSAVISQTNGTHQQSQAGKASPKTQAANTDRGQEVFHQNCYRCHQEPQGFSPNISGTIARHMRVRANLSDSDYKALLKFLNP
jgi:mono/diheme cytochrome c family protein